jgi:hypothetical protein
MRHNYRIKRFFSLLFLSLTVNAIQAQTPQSKNRNAKQNAAKTAATKTTATIISKQTAKPQALAQERYITTAFDVNLREEPSVSANNLGQIKLGTPVRSSERTPGKQTLGNREDFWHKIETAATADGKSKKGWIFGGFLRPLPADKRETVYREIAEERAAAAGKNFSNNVELYEFLTRIAPELKTPNAAATLGLARLRALRAALAEIPIEKQNEPLYKNFIVAQDKNIVYSEPSGQWYVRSEMFWNLSKKYKQTLPEFAERAAWEAAENPLPGECEGYLNCYLYLMNTTYGAYLQAFPRGAHGKEALKTLNEWLAPIAADARKKEVYSAPADVSDRAEFNQSIADLRVVISKTGFFEKDVVLRQLSQIAEGYR